MTGISRRRLLTATATAGALGGLGVLTACSANDWSVGSSARGTPAATPKPKLIGDGSTADTGAQPKQPKAERLKPGERPPQFVVFSWDGAGELSNKLFSRFRKVAADHGASMTFFLSGIYTLPQSKKHLYSPPQHPVGASAIGYLSDRHIHSSASSRSGPPGSGPTNPPTATSAARDSVRRGPAEWRSDMQQFVTEWKTNTGFTDLEPFPFDYEKELIGGRAPCCPRAEPPPPPPPPSAGSTTPAAPAA